MERDSKDVVQKPAPYLRSGKGTESRQQASQSSRRYIPKGGFVIDFTTQPLPKGKGRAAPNGCHTDVSREVLIARQQRAAARLSAPKHSAGNSPVTKKLELPDLEFPDHPKPWGAARCRAILKENIGPHLATSGHTKQMGYHERVPTQARPSSRTVETKACRVDTLYAAQQPGETLDDNDIFDDDAPLLSAVQISKTPDATPDSVLTDPFQALAERQAMHAPVTSLYVQQLLTPETSAPESAVQKELLDLKDQITQAAAVLELEKQAFQRSRIEDETAWREVTKREERRLQRDKAILSRQSQVLLKLPSKRERAEVEALSEALEKERRMGRAKDARHKLTVQRLQRHVTQLQGKVAELEDEVRWHSRRAADSAQLPSRTRQPYNASVMPHKPEQYHSSRLLEGEKDSVLQEAFPHDPAAKRETLKQRIAEGNPEGQQPVQRLSSRPATPEHPEKQLCSSEVMRKQGRTAAAGVPGLHQALPALGDAAAQADVARSTRQPAGGIAAQQSSQEVGLQQAMATIPVNAAHGSSSEAGGKKAEGNEDNLGNVPDRMTGIREVPEHGRHHSNRQRPLAVSWQIESVRNRKPAFVHQTPSKSQGLSVAHSAVPVKLSTHDNETSSSRKGHDVVADVKLNSSTPVRTGLAPASQFDVQSAHRPSERPKARTLPPLPDFVSLEAFKSRSYSQDMPRMEALYAATDRTSAFPERPTPQAESAKIHHSSQMQDVESTRKDMPSPSSGAAGQSTSGMQGRSSAERACKEEKHKSPSSSQCGVAIKHDQALGSPDRSRQVLRAPLCSALHEEGATGMLGRAATGMQQCSTEGLQDETMSQSRVLHRPVSPRVETLDLVASSSRVSADASGASSGVNDAGTAERDVDVQLSGCTAASADEYSSIKASLRTLQELLNNPQSPTLISEHTNDSKAGSSSVTSDAGKAYRRDSHSTAAASAQGDEQPMSRPDAHPQPTFRNTPELTQAVCGAPSYISQQPAQRNGFQHGETHSELAELPDGGQGSAASSDNHPCRHHGKQDISVGGVDGLDSQAAIPSNHPDGRTAVRFKNGDCKRSYTNGTVEYYYAKADTWHTTCPGDIEVYYFPSGQTEAHHPGGLKEIIFQDGSIRLVDSEGAESVAELEHLGNAVRRSRPDWKTVADPSV